MASSPPLGGSNRRHPSSGHALSSTLPSSRRFQAQGGGTDSTPRLSYLGTPHQGGANSTTISFSSASTSTPLMSTSTSLVASQQRRSSLAQHEVVSIHHRDPYQSTTPETTTSQSSPTTTSSRHFPHQHPPSSHLAAAAPGPTSILSPIPRRALAYITSKFSPSPSSTSRLSPPPSRRLSKLSNEADSPYNGMGLTPKTAYRRTSLLLHSPAGMSKGATLRRGVPARMVRKNAVRLFVVLAIIVIFVKWRGVDPNSIKEAFMGELDQLSGQSVMWGAKKTSIGVEVGEDEVAKMRYFRETTLWAKLDPSEYLSAPSIFEPKAKHQETVIFIHGLAQHSWDSPLPSQLSNRFPSVRWVMPQAPHKNVHVRNNESTPAWFDMLHFPYNNTLDEDPTNLYLSVRQLNAVIRSEQKTLIDTLRNRGGMESLPPQEQVHTSLRGGDEQESGNEIGTAAEREWASSRIVLAGFSQGGVMTLLTGLTLKDRLAGLVVMSGYMPLRAQLRDLVADLDRTTMPIFWGHGIDDEYLLYEDATVSVNLLQATQPTPDAHQGGLGLTAIEFRSYQGLGHSWQPSEMTHIGNWLEKVLPSKRTPRSVG